MKAHFLTLLAALLLSLSSLCLHAQEAAPAEKKANAPITMAGKHEISFNLRNLSFNEVNNSILGLAYRYHWNAKWNLRVQADVALSSFLTVTKTAPDTAFNGTTSYSVLVRPNAVNVGVLLGVERKWVISRFQPVLGFSLGYAFKRSNTLILDPVSGGASDEGLLKERIFRFRPSLGMRYQFTSRFSATIETALSFDYSIEFFDARPINLKLGSVESSFVKLYSIPISSLTLNLHL